MSSLEDAACGYYYYLVHVQMFSFCSAKASGGKCICKMISDAQIRLDFLGFLCKENRFCSKDLMNWHQNHSHSLFFVITNHRVSGNRCNLSEQLTDEDQKI